HVVGYPATGGPAGSPSTGGDWRIDSSIPELPGSLAAGVSLSTTDAVGATDALLDVEASRPIGEGHVTAWDDRPDRAGFAGDAVGPDRTPVPELLLDLHGAGDELHVTARLRGAEDVNVGPTHSSLPGRRICGAPGAPQRRGAPGIAYVHA